MTARLPAIILAALPAKVTALIEWDTTSVRGSDGQFERSDIVGAKIRPGATVADLLAALAAVERSLQPCGRGDIVVEALAPMYATRRNRPGDQVDEQASLSILATRLQGFPRDVIVQAGNHFIDTTPWMPAISEMLQVVERMMRSRRALKAALEQAIARASVSSAPQLEAPKVGATAEERARDLIAFRRGAGKTREAALEERWLASRERRAVESWAKPILDEIDAEANRARAEFQRLADEEARAKPKPLSKNDLYLAQKAQARRDAILGIKRENADQASLADNTGHR